MLIVRQPLAETRYREEWDSFVVIDPLQVRPVVHGAVGAVSMRRVTAKLAIATNNAPAQLPVDGVVRHLSILDDKGAH
ncbi:hypothetical protein D3C72_1955120 [compost metagenome]